MKPVPSAIDPRLVRTRLPQRASSGHCEHLEPRRLLSGTPQGNEFLVNTTILNDQFAPAVARDYLGNFVIVWASETTDPTNTNVFGQRYNAAGVPQGGQFLVNTFTTGLQTRPAVAMDIDGDFVVAWQSGTSNSALFAGQDGSGWGIYAQRFSSAGVPQGSEFRVNTFTNSDQEAPSVAMDDNGNFVVAWHSLGQDGSDRGVYAKRYNPAGSTVGSEFRVNTFTTHTQQDPSVAMDAFGNFVVAWTSGTLASPGGQDGSYYGIYAQRYNSSGATQGGEFRVNTFTNDFQTDPSVAMDRDGDFVVAWNSFGQDGSDYGIYAQRYNAAGTPQGSEFRVNTFTTGSQSDPRVDMNLFGDFVITWASTNQDGSGRGVYHQFYNANGTPSGTEQRVNTFTPNNQSRPAIALDANGNYIIAFQDGSTIPNVAGQDGSGYGIYARRYIAPDKLPPTVVSAGFNFLTNQSLSIQFSENVQPSFATNDLQVLNLTTGQTISAAVMSISYNVATNVATVTFNTLLPDGNYRVTLLAAGITDAVGLQLDANRDGVGGDNYIFSFYVLAGDANRDRTVNLQDFNILASNFGQSGRNFSQGDFNYDGVVNLQDFNILASRFGTSLPPPASVVPGSTGSTARGAGETDDDEDDVSGLV